MDRAYLVYRGGAGLFRLLPRRFGLTIAGLAGEFSAARHPEVRAKVAANLSHIVGPTDPKVMDALVLRSYREYSRYWAATARLRRRDRDWLKAHTVVKGRDAFDIGLHGAAIYALPHLGAWEIGGFWAVNEGLDLTVVVEPTLSPELGAFFRKVRSDLGMHVVELGPSVATTLLKILRDGRSIALLADRDLLGDGIKVDFFSAPTLLPPGPAVLALRAGVPIIPTGTYLQRDGGMRMSFGPAIQPRREGHLRDDVTRVTREVAAAFENLIGAAPTQWHVFQPNWPSDIAEVD